MRLAEGHPFSVLDFLRRLFGCLLMVFGLPWDALGEFLAPLGCPWASLGPLLARFGGAWEVSGELPGGPSALWRCLWVPDFPKTSKMEPPGTKITIISIKTEAKSLNCVPDFFFKVVPCNAFRKGKPKQILSNSYPIPYSKLFPAALFAKGNPREIYASYLFHLGL